MAISLEQNLVIKNFPPTILLEPDNIIFEFLQNYEEKSERESFSNKSDLLHGFNKFIMEFYKKDFQNKKKILENKLLDTLKKLNNITLFFVGAEIIEFDWDKYDSIYNLLRHIKKSDERKIQWAIYHLFCLGHKTIPLDKLDELLSGFQIRNIVKLTKSIVEYAMHDGMKATFNESQIIINHKLEDPIVKICLADQLEFYSRRPRRRLESEILDLLDEGTYSNEEISDLLDTDKSQISKAMKKLATKHDIKFVATGTRGSHYYTTDCSNCPFGTNFDSCRKESISYIVTAVEKDFGVKIRESELNQVEHNQSLLFIKKIMMMRRNKTRLMDDIIEKLTKIYGMALEKSLKHGVSRKEDIPYANLNSFLEKTPLLYEMGFRFGTANGVNLMSTFIGEILGPYLKNKKYSKEIQDRVIQEFKKLKFTLDTK